MSRQKPVRHQLRQHIRPSQDVPRSSKLSAKPRQQPSLQLGFWLQNYTLLLWLAALAILLGSATAAVTSIMDPDASVPYHATIADADLASEPSAPSNSALTNPPQVQAKPSEQTQRTDTASPLSAGGALLLSCAAGCLLLSQWLKPSKSPRASKRSRSTRRLDQVRAQSLHSHQAPQAPLAKLSLPEAKPLDPLPPAVQPSFALSPAQPQLNTSSKPATEVPVTVVPVDQSHPLDWDEPSLADSLDLRQHRPLSYWLHR